MSRRPSALSFSLPAPLANGPVNVVQSPIAPEALRQSRRPSLSKLPNGTSELDPDELFTKCTVAEVKFAQQRLRADADAKQEELRLMVGERYRDLLQASTSIVSIARSSSRVIGALQEAKDAILSQDEPPMPQRASTFGSDTHLYTLQLLSAHMKLLLDAPEYLWRLIERKKYFTAAWLFLLARVVHRALVREDEETWKAQGIDVLEQFPLAQRQWEAVSQFRSQITHRATVFLREYTASAEDVCAALLTLHLLDSRPLPETLFVFLSQRTKTFLAVLSRAAEISPISPLSPPFLRRTNGHVHEMSPAPLTSRKASVREVKEALQSALDAIIKTLATSRDIFEEVDSKHSMIRTVLEYIQSDSSSPSSLPSELQLTTQSLLATLPSSTQFLILPPSLRSYKPYVDLSSSSSLVEQAFFGRILDDWFQTSNQSLQVAVSKWFLDLHTVTEVWTLRSSIRQWIDFSVLKREEVVVLKTIFDDAARQRVLGIWKLALSDAEDAFQLQLATAAASLREDSKELLICVADNSPIEFLFNAAPLPVFTGLGPVDSSFQKYKATLRRQLLGRTSLLDGVLATLENCVRSLQRDLSVVRAGEDGDAHNVMAQLSEQYRPSAEALCTGVLDTLSSAEKQENDDSEFKIDSLVFIGQVADELASSSPFVSDIGGAEEVVHDFKKRTKALHDRVIDRWRTYTVSRIIGQRRTSFRPKTTPLTSARTPPTPSSALMESLLALSRSVQELTIARGQNSQADETLRLFITEWIGDDWKQESAQAICDIDLLRRLVDFRTSEWEDVCQLLDSKERQLREQGGIQMEDRWKDASADYLARTQTLLATLLPLQSPMRASESSSTDKLVPLLSFGSPAVDQQFQPAVELAKPSSRFGLLLVGTTAR
ncbi:Vps51/Vps67 domain-containing protein [Mycena pura]|uniref:Conserved oligomeric Golgi complex subunit 1 n=1 Tax=Mycena pura TaxID=153505 RepID=A0AAD6YP40_9AGAR|nr:Vps51/Vps67 domain-containing protein [Mycena pura]